MLKVLNTGAYFRSSLIRDFRKAGYHTAVMYTSRSVGDVNRIYRLSGFEETVDGTDPFFDHSMRLTFDSVPDRDLFDRALVQIRKREKMGPPFFTFIPVFSTSYLNKANRHKA